jgi:CheY-like chemotaxis protein
MADINQQLLSLSRRAYYEQQPMNLNSVIEDMVELIKRSGISQNIEIITELSSKTPNIRGSPEQLLRVVQNLCQNAIDAMGESGTLTIKTELAYLDRPLQHYEDMELGEYVKLTVSDTGSGIPKEIWDKIFDPFFTTKKTNKQHGSGLGLSVVHGIVKDHKGYIDLSSEVGKGTSFFVYFPVCYEGKLHTYHKELVKGEGTILLIDDDALQTEVAGRILEKLGYTVLTANSSQEAFKIFKECQQKNAFPDLVILDMILNNDMDGSQIYEHIKQFNPAQKAILISGYAESDKVDRAMALGAGAFLRKPVTAEKLGQAVEKELSRPTTQKLPE